MDGSFLLRVMFSQSMPHSDMRPELTRKLRECYKPNRVRSLLVGVSPPKLHFFYDCTSGGSTISTATRQVFEKVYWREQEYPGKAEFLCDFKAKRWYLYDLYEDPDESVGVAPLEEGSKAWRQLEDLLRAEEPEAVSALFKRIERPWENLVEKLVVRPRLVRGLRYVTGAPQEFKKNLEELIRDLDGMPF